MVLFYALAFLPTFAQKVKYVKKEKKIYVDNKPYSVMLEVGGKFGTDYSIKTLSEKEIIFFKYDNRKNFYEVVFMETGEKAYWDSYVATKKNMAQYIVDNQFLKDDLLNQTAKYRYLLLNSKEPAPKPDQATGKFQAAINGIGEKKEATTPNNGVMTQYPLVERNKQVSFFAMNGQINQDSKLIGLYKEKTDLANGKTYKTFVLKLTDGTTIAEAKGEGVAPKDYEVFSFLDRRTGHVTVRFTTSPLEDIAKYLTDNRYL